MMFDCTFLKVTRKSYPNGDVLDITFDMPDSKINTLSANVLSELERVLDAINTLTDVKLVVFKSAKKDIFIAGADINEIADLKDLTIADEKVKKGQDILNKIAQLKTKTLAIINGASMGGGTELALACNYRIVTDSPKSQIALPEIKLGIFPGFGGSQRLPRLIGLVKSLDIMLTGKNLDSRKAFKMGIVDDLVPCEFLEFHENRWIEMILSKGVKSSRKLDLVDRLAKFYPIRYLIILRAKQQVIKKTGLHYPAAFNLLEVIKQTYFIKNFNAGLDFERKKFIEVAVGDVCKNLVRLFFVNEKLKKDYNFSENVDVSNIGVLGAGVMGGGIGWLFSNAGYNVRIKDISWNAIGIGWKQVWANFSEMTKHKKLKPHELNKKIANITATTDNQGLEKANVIIEAVVEDLVIKQKVLGELEKLAPLAIIATNTSSLTIKDISQGLQDKTRFVGMHFFNPVNKMPLVEIISGQDTSKQAIATVVNLARKSGKVPIVVGDCAGFVVNRLLLPYMNEAVLCLEDIGYSPATVERIDNIFKNFGMPMGPFHLADEVGLDVCYKVSQNLYKTYGDRMKTAKILEQVYNEYHFLGKKAQKGFYVYSEKGHKQYINPDIKIPKLVKYPLTDTEILERCLFVMINEAYKVIKEGILSNEEYLDMAMIMGTGFPPFRGGLIQYAKSIGLENIKNRLSNFQQKYGNRFAPTID